MEAKNPLEVPMSRIGAGLAQFIKENGYSIRGIADVIGITEGTLRYILNGRHRSNRDIPEKQCGAVVLKRKSHNRTLDALLKLDLPTELRETILQLRYHDARALRTPRLLPHYNETRPARVA